VIIIKIKLWMLTLIAFKVDVEIVDDNQWEPDEEFFLKLSLVATENNENVQLGHMSIMEITILNDDG
jgi:solute carrier family 8 (sodium/calcium exchanger)